MFCFSSIRICWTSAEDPESLVGAELFEENAEEIKLDMSVGRLGFFKK